MFVVAIFGGTSNPPRWAPDFAYHLGACCAQRGWVVLSGGDGKSPRSKAIKDKAHEGAKSNSGRFIGVLQEGGPRPEPVEPRGLVLYTDLGHKRNYVEACLCDIAIALPGTNGTVSEAVCTLCLQKQVVLVGEAWKRRATNWLTCEKPPSEELREELVSVATQRLNKSGLKPLIDECIRGTVIESNLRCAWSRCSFQPESTMASDVCTDIANLLSKPPKTSGRRGFPGMGPEYSELADVYERFLSPE